jgi:outer membrane protein TolC
MMKKLRLIAAGVAAIWLAGCAVQRPPAQVAAAAPAQWYAPLPHNGTLADLSAWWSQFNDPLLIELIEAAQSAKPTVASAASRIRQAQSTRVAAGAA